MSAKRVRWSYRIATLAYEPVSRGLPALHPLSLIDEALAIVSRQMGQLYVRHGKTVRMPSGMELPVESWGPSGPLVQFLKDPNDSMYYDSIMMQMRELERRSGEKKVKS